MVEVSREVTGRAISRRPTYCFITTGAIAPGGINRTEIRGLGRPYCQTPMGGTAFRGIYSIRPSRANQSAGPTADAAAGEVTRGRIRETTDAVFAAGNLARSDKNQIIDIDLAN